MAGSSNGPVQQWGVSFPHVQDARRLRNGRTSEAWELRFFGLGASAAAAAGGDRSLVQLVGSGLGGNTLTLEAADALKARCECCKWPCCGLIERASFDNIL